MGKLLGVMEIFYILIVVMISLLYADFRFIKLYTFNGYNLLHINYASIVGFLKAKTNKKNNHWVKVFRELDIYMVSEN